MTSLHAYRGNLFSTKMVTFKNHVDDRLDWPDNLT